MASRILSSRVSASIKRVGARFQSTVTDGVFSAERDAVKHHAADAAATWKKISIFIVIPALAAAGFNTYKLYEEHVEHQKRHPKEWVKYPYINYRSRDFFWGKESFFFNPNVNLSAVDQE